MVVTYHKHENATNARRLKDAATDAPHIAIFSAVTALKHYLLYDYSID
jgi:hypothetical protein